MRSAASSRFSWQARRRRRRAGSRLSQPGRARTRAGWLEPALLGAPLVLLFVVLLVYPVGQLLLSRSTATARSRSRNTGSSSHSSVYVDVMLITLKISLWTTLLASSRAIRSPT